MIYVWAQLDLTGIDLPVSSPSYNQTPITEIQSF